MAFVWFSADKRNPSHLARLVVVSQYQRGKLQTCADLNPVSLPEMTSFLFLSFGLACMEWVMQGPLLLLACVKSKCNKYFRHCYRNLVNTISWLYLLPAGYNVRDCFALLGWLVFLFLFTASPVTEQKLSSVFMASEGRFWRCTQDCFALMSIELCQMCLHNLWCAQSTPLAPEVGVQWGKSSSGRALNGSPLTAVGAVVVLQ